MPRAQVALAWVLQKSVISAPIVGATKAHHLDDAVAALSLKLSADEVKQLEELYVPHAVTGFNINAAPRMNGRKASSMQQREAPHRH